MKRSKIFAGDYRHIICTAITLLFLGAGFLFPNALPRLAETVRDLGLSIAFYFCELIIPNSNPIQPTVLRMPTWAFSESIWKPLEIFPYSWEEFKVMWKNFWVQLFTGENFGDYWYSLSDVIYYISRIIGVRSCRSFKSCV